MDEQPLSNDANDNSQTTPSPDEIVTPKPVIEPSPSFVPDTAPVYVNRRPDSRSYSDPVISQQQPEPVTPTVATPEKTSPGIIVLQWLTYAFWGWTVLAMSVLVLIVLTFFLVDDAHVGDAPVYSMAAVLVLLPISVVCDLFYMKHETEKKIGASSVIMIIHAVIFALFGIGALITVVFSLVNLFISASGSKTTSVFLYSGLIIAVLYALVFVRTILPKFLFKFRKIFIAVMIAAVGVMCVMAIFGPTMEARLTRNDTLIESNLSYVQDSIDDYASSNSRLPDDLNSIKLSGDAEKLITEKLVIYKKDTRPSGYDEDYMTFYYQLCVDYVKAKNESYDYSSSYNQYNNDDGYETYLSAYSHPAGEVCYKVKYVDHNSYAPEPSLLPDENM